VRGNRARAPPVHRRLDYAVGRQDRDGSRPNADPAGTGVDGCGMGCTVAQSCAGTTNSAPRRRDGREDLA
jgi:hypothetical protein